MTLNYVFVPFFPRTKILLHFLIVQNKINVRTLNFKETERIAIEKYGQLFFKLVARKSC